MFFNNINRRNFFLQLFGTVITGTAFAEFPRLTASITQVNGKKLLRSTTVTPPGTIGDPKIQTSLDGKSWSDTPITNNVSEIPATNKMGMVKLATITILIDNTNYIVPLTSSQTLLATMGNLKVFLPTFTFVSQTYPLGQFVTEINGVRRGGGRNWIVFINGQSSTLGSSNLPLKANDIIEWRLI